MIMDMKVLRYISIVVAVLMSATSVFAQVDRHDVRIGNRKFKKGDYKDADIAYRKALVKDSTSVPANYNLANTLYRQKGYDEAGKVMDRIKDAVQTSPQASDYYYNTGNIAIARKDWQSAVNAFKEALLRNPSDIDAKENYIYAKKKLEDQQKNGGGGQNNQDNNQNDQDDSQGNQNDQNQNNDQNQQNHNGQDNQDNRNQSNGNDQQQGQVGNQQVKISPQQAQQILKAIQAKEKETQDKVNKEKSEALRSRQREKNW